VSALQIIKILVAVTPTMRDTAKQALQCADFDMSFCHSLNQAKQFLLETAFDIVICTLQFDESRLCDLLQFIRTTPLISPTPFVALTFWKEGEGMLSVSAVKTALHSAKLCGAIESINLPQWRQQSGDEAAFEKLRSCIRQLATRKYAE